MKGIVPMVMATMSLLVATANANGICFIVYQIADTTSIEGSVREDLYEITISPLVEAPSTTTWVYHDAKNLATDKNAEKAPLENVFTADGSQLLGDANNGKKEEGSSYFTYRHDLGKMVQERLLDNGNEIDSDDPKTKTDFLKVALTSCVENKATEFMLVFSSHGAGFGGYGGDSNKRQRRRLTSPNSDIKSAVIAALAGVPGAPSKLDVLGFDACLMQGFGAIDDYHSITKYYLASEAVEPGHGWRYDFLTESSSSLNLAKQVVTTFTQGLHGDTVHQNPKTMAIVDTSKYDAFLSAMEAFFGFLQKALSSSSNKDPNIWALLSRTHKSAVKFVGFVDNKAPDSAVDIGSYLSTFQEQCNPTAELSALISAALTAYNSLFIDRQNGPTTSAGTGMAILLPSKNLAISDVLFDDPQYVTSTAPQYIAFLRAYYEGFAPSEATGTSACQTSTVSTSPPDKEGGMLSGTSLAVSSSRAATTNRVCVTTQASARTDEIVAEFGINFALESSDEARRKLTNTVARRNQMLKPDTVRRGMLRQQNQRKSTLHDGRRRMQDSSGDYLLLFGGEVPGTYTGASYTACWNRKFFLIEDTKSNRMEEVYAFDQGQGSRSIPVVYFPPSTNSSVLATSFFDARDAYAMGGKPAFATFSVDDTTGEPLDNLILFSRELNAFGSFAEVSKDGGWIFPIIFVEAVIEGESIDEIVGGFGNTHLAWDNSTTIRMKTVTDAEYFEMFETSDDPAGPLLITVSALDHDVGSNGTDDLLGSESASVNIAITGATPQPSPAPTPPPTPPPTAQPTPATQPSCEVGDIKNGFFACGDKAFCVAGRSSCTQVVLADQSCVSTCECLSGYGGRSCTDINECATKNPCPTANSFCVDYDPPQKFKCGCLPGFTGVTAANDATMISVYGSVDPVPLSWRPLECIPV